MTASSSSLALARRGVRATAVLDALPSYVFADLELRKHAARAAGATLIDLGIGSPDRSAPAEVVAELQRAAADPATHGYPPFRGVPRFLESIERFMLARFGVSIDADRQALVVAGSKEGMAELAFACLEAGDVVLVPEIYYPVYARAPLLAGAHVHLVPMPAETGFLVDLDAVPEDVLRRARMLILNYPNNPTGATAPRDFLERAVSFARAHDLLLVSDLAYSELGFDGYMPTSVLEIPGAADVAIELHSCSKSFNMAGFRIGFAVGSPDAIEVLAAYRTNVGYGAPSLTQYAAAYALDHSGELTRPVAARYEARRDAAVEALRAIGWPVSVPRAAMYLWLPMPRDVEDWAFVQALIDDAGVVVTPGTAFGAAGRGWFRISLVAEPAALGTAIDRMSEVRDRRRWRW